MFAVVRQTNPLAQLSDLLPLLHPSSVAALADYAWELAGEDSRRQGQQRDRRRAPPVEGQA